MQRVQTTHAPIGAIDLEPPRCLMWRENLLEAATLACALMAQAGSPLRAAARMNLINETRRRGLVGTSPQSDVLAMFDAQMARLTYPRASRRQAARAMNRFVGTPWAGIVTEIATAFAAAGATPPERAAVVLDSLRVALGLTCSNDC